MIEAGANVPCDRALTLPGSFQAGIARIISLSVDRSWDEAASVASSDLLEVQATFQTCDAG